MTARYIVGDVFDVLATLEPASVDLIVTSPPFLALRSYLPADHPDKAREIGSEATPGAFIDRMLDVVEACARVLAPHGSLVFELGDTYSGSTMLGGPPIGGSWVSTRTAENDNRSKAGTAGWPLDKSKVLIPQLFAIALAYGFNPLTGRQTEPWRVRNTVAWCRPNPPVGRDGDKFRPATSFLTVACKARDRYWDGDAVRTAWKDPNDNGVREHGFRRHLAGGVPGGDTSDPSKGENNPAGAPLLDYWVIPTAPYKGSHYATYPPDLVVPLVKSMCPARVCRVCGNPSTRIVESVRGADPNRPEPYSIALQAQGMRHGWGTRTTGSETTYTTLGWSDCGCTPTPEHYPEYPPGSTHRVDMKWRPGLVLDPFAGSGTTLAVATGHGFDCIGIDLDERNADLARERVGMFLEVDYGSPPAAEALTIEPRF